LFKKKLGVRSSAVVHRKKAFEGPLRQGTVSYPECGEAAALWVLVLR